jgi:hypothetical protein
VSSYPVTFATEEGLGFIYNSLIDKSIKSWYIELWLSVLDFWLPYLLHSISLSAIKFP